MICPRCSQEKDEFVDHLCGDCHRLENNRYSLVRNKNEEWPLIAEQAGLNLWERQPEETDTEWRAWLNYRDSYPFRKPDYREAAAAALTTYNNVRAIAVRWDWSMRMQAYAKYVDELTLRQRQEQIVEMNKRHVDMAAALNSKVAAFIDALDIRSIEVKDLRGLMQIATELERKGRLDQTDLTKGIVADGTNPELKDSPTSQQDLGEVVRILQTAGVIPSNATVGIETTQRVVIKDAGN